MDGPLTHASNKAGYTATLIVCGWAARHVDGNTRPKVNDQPRDGVQAALMAGAD